MAGLLLVLLIFGPRRLPQTGRALGRSLREFKEGIAGRDTPARDTPPGTETHSHWLHN